MTLLTRSLRLASIDEELRHHIIRVVAREFANEKALTKHLKDHPGAEKSDHTVKTDGGKSKKDKKDKDGVVYSEKHKVRLKGISEKKFEEFLASPDAEALKQYNLEVIAGEDHMVDAESLKRAVKVRKNMLAIQKAKDKPKSERTQADDDALDVCKTTPAVCDDNMGISRSSMPQFTQISIKKALGDPPDKRFKELLEAEKSDSGLPESMTDPERDAFYSRKNAEVAVEQGADPNSDKSTFDNFVDRIKKNGVTVKTPKGGMRVGDLKATQSEISGDKVLRNADKYLRGGDLSGGAIYVSKDGHILDGHHRWAGLLTADPNAKIPVVQVDMDMADLLEESFMEPGVFRQDFRFRTVSEDDPIDLARKPGDTWKQRNNKFYGKGPDGDAGGPFDSEAAAKSYASGKKASLIHSIVRLARQDPAIHPFDNLKNDAEGGKSASSVATLYNRGNVTASSRGAFMTTERALRKNLIRLAGSYPKGSPNRRKLLNVITGSDFDPREIGEVEKGPVDHNQDESFMEDEFTQQEFSELGDLQESGQLGMKVHDHEATLPVGQQERMANDKALFDSLVRLAKNDKKARGPVLNMLREAGYITPEGKVASDKFSGCEKLPEGGMRDNCEKKVEEGKKNDAKKAATDEDDKDACGIDDQAANEDMAVRAGLIRLAKTNPAFARKILPLVVAFDKERGVDHNDRKIQAATQGAKTAKTAARVAAKTALSLGYSKAAAVAAGKKAHAAFAA